jgi:ABC-type polar amino acid transport system ATPase subunit
VLRPLLLSVARGEVFGIVGHSGAGKSTLRRMIKRLESARAGQMRRAARTSPHRTRPPCARCIAHRHHFPVLRLAGLAHGGRQPALSLELADEPTGRIRARVDGLPGRAGLADRAWYCLAQLSGGQKQRVGIARTQAAAPDILLCDEATSGLDPQTTASVLPPLARLNRKRGLVIVPITGEMDVVRCVCERLAVSMPPRVLDQVALALIDANDALDAGHPDNKDDPCVRKLAAALTRPGVKDCMGKKCGGAVLSAFRSGRLAGMALRSNGDRRETGRGGPFHVGSRQAGSEPRADAEAQRPRVQLDVLADAGAVHAQVGAFAQVARIDAGKPGGRDVHVQANRADGAAAVVQRHLAAGAGQAIDLFMGEIGLVVAHADERAEHGIGRAEVVLRAQCHRLLVDGADLAGRAADAMVELVGRAPQFDGKVVVEEVAAADGRRQAAIDLADAGGGIVLGLQHHAATDDGPVLARSGIGRGVLGESGRRESQRGKSGQAQQ